MLLIMMLFLLRLLIFFMYQRALMLLSVATTGRRRRPHTLFGRPHVGGVALAFALAAPLRARPAARGAPSTPYQKFSKVSALSTFTGRVCAQPGAC
jgi:hypothetical protein